MMNLFLSSRRTSGRTPYWQLRCIVTFVLVWCAEMVLVQTSSWVIAQQIGVHSSGLNELKSDRLTLITDLPIDGELKDWPMFLEQALEGWRVMFSIPESRLSQFKPTVYLIGNRKRWDELGLLGGVPGFIDGYQFGDNLYLIEQPSVYYRRLLFLHEATHWIMWRSKGGTGPFWFMEGIADMSATHRLEGEGSSRKLHLGFFPKSPSQVPYWGRIRLIQGATQSSTAPTLEEILSWRDASQQRMERYSWGWAAVTFLSHHPQTSNTMRELRTNPIDSNLDRISEVVLAELQELGPVMQVNWRAFVDQIDFGMNVERLGLVESQMVPLEELSGKKTLQVRSDWGWQSTGILLPAGTTIEISARGRYVVRSFSDRSEVWESEPAGVTVQYERGHPLGALIAAMVPLDNSRPLGQLESVLIGRNSTIHASQDSLLLLKVNEKIGELEDNRGVLDVAIQSLR